jgi:hypothetical protein
MSSAAPTATGATAEDTVERKGVLSLGDTNAQPHFEVQMEISSPGPAQEEVENTVTDAYYYSQLHPNVDDIIQGVQGCAVFATCGCMWQANAIAACTSPPPSDSWVEVQRGASIELARLA